MSTEAIVILAATIVIALVGVIYKFLRDYDREISNKIDEHIKEDAKVHERVTRLEERTERHERDIGDHSKPGTIVHRLHEYSKWIRELTTKFNMMKREDE